VGLGTGGGADADRGDRGNVHWSGSRGAVARERLKTNPEPLNCSQPGSIVSFGTVLLTVSNLP
jgi:hypothetical protein